MVRGVAEFGRRMMSTRITPSAKGYSKQVIHAGSYPVSSTNNIYKMSEELDRILEESGFKIPSFEDDIKHWKPEDYGFEPKRINEILLRCDIYYKGNFELRRRPFDYWLCRKKVTNDRGNTEYLQRFYFKILPEEIDFAEKCLTLGLR